MVLTRISGQIPLAGAEPSPLSGGQPGARPRSADGGQSCGGGAAVTGEVADLVGARRGRGNRSPRSRPLGVGRCALLPGTGAGRGGPAPGRITFGAGGATGLRRAPAPPPVPAPILPRPAPDST